MSVSERSVPARNPLLAALRLRWSTFSTLARDIILVLVAKIVVLTLIWAAFFRDPAAPGMTMDPGRVETRLLAPPSRDP